MSVSFQSQNIGSVGTHQVPLQRLRHQRAFSSGIAQAKECHSQFTERLTSTSGVFQSGSTTVQSCIRTQRRTARQALISCQAGAEKQTIAVTGAKICRKGL